MVSYRDNRVYGNRRDFGPDLVNQGIDWALGERGAIMLPAWLKLIRWKGCICGYTSTDGLNWLSLNQGTAIALGDKVQVGMLVNRGGAPGTTTGSFDNVYVGPLRLNYRTSWFGNSYGDAHWVQDHIADMAVAADGTCYTQAEYDEAGRNQGIYKDGKVLGSLRGSGSGTGGKAISIDGKYVYIGCEVDKMQAIRRYTLDGKLAPFEKGGPKGNVVTLGQDVSGVYSLVVRGNLAYVVDVNTETHNGATSNDQVKVFDIAGGAATLKASTEITRPGRIAVDEAGRIWIIQGVLRDAALILRVPGKVLCLSPDCRRVGPDITDMIEPNALAFDNQKRLLVAENGPDMQVRIYTGLDTAPRCVATFGKKGGVYADTPGEIGDLKLMPNIVGLGTDSQGNLYIGSDGWTWCGTDIRKFTPEGKMVWRLHGAMGVVQFAGFDPADPTHLFNKSMHYAMDWSKPLGQEAVWKGYTYDPRTFPDDPRRHVACESTMARTIAGRRFLFKTDMGGSFLAVYRFDARHGEVAIPCGLISAGRIVKYPGRPSEAYWPKDQPRNTGWIWADKNGDSRIQTEELAATNIGHTFDIDANGDIWTASDKVYHHRFHGLDQHGSPTWEPKAKETPRPAPFDGNRDELRRIKYDAATDTLYLSGFTKDHPNRPWNGFPVAGRFFARYDHWTKKPAPATQIAFPHDLFTGANVKEGVDVAGDYLFAVDVFSARVSIYDLRNGNLVGAMVAGPEIVGASGWVDMPFSLSAHKLPGGEYLVLAEEDWRNKEIIYRWKPDLVTATVTPTLTAAEGTLYWAAPMTAGSFNLYRGREGGKPELFRRNLTIGRFTDSEWFEGSCTYYVTSVNAKGESGPSNAITIPGPERGLVELKGQVFASTLPVEAGRGPETAFDNDPLTQYRTLAQNGGYVGIDLGAGKARRVVKVRFLGNPNPELLMLGGKFQGSNGDKDQGPYMDLAQIENSPVEWGELRVHDPKPYRYLRYIGVHGSRCNVCEIKFYGSKADAAEDNLGDR
jgi:hypothetical protein